MLLKGEEKISGEEGTLLASRHRVPTLNYDTRLLPFLGLSRSLAIGSRWVFNCLTEDTHKTTATSRSAAYFLGRSLLGFASYGVFLQVRVDAGHNFPARVEPSDTFVVHHMLARPELSVISSSRTVFISRRAHRRGLVDDFGARRYLRQGRLQDSGHWNEGTSLVGHASCGRRAL